MTPDTIMEIALDRVGLTSSSSVFKNRAREYLNMAGADIHSRTRWLWAFKSGSILTVASTKQYDLTADVQEPLEFRDESNDNSLVIVSVLDTDRHDPDQSETGDPEFVVLVGIDTSTGYWSVDLRPTPDTTADLISYRYYSKWTDKTSSDDTTDLASSMPSWLQPALIHGIASNYYYEKGAYDQAATEERERERIIGHALRINTQGEGMKQARLQRPPIVEGFNFRVQKGTLT